MVPTRPSRAEASAGLSPAPWAAKTASTSGTSPSGVCWISLRSAHATGIFWRSGSWASSKERVPASAESLALASRLSAEHRRDQQQAEHQSGVAGRDRPAAGTHQAGRLREAGRAEDRERQPHARAAEGERDRGQRTADPREEGQPGQAAREHDRTGGAADRGAHAGGERAHRERRRGERADDDRAGDGVVAPDDDEQQHAEEQRADERAERQHLADVGEERAPLDAGRGDRRRLRRTLGAATATDRGDRDGHLDEEDGPPGEDLGEEPAQGRPDRGAERRGRHPPGAAPAHGAGQVDEHGQGATRASAAPKPWSPRPA